MEKKIINVSVEVTSETSTEKLFAAIRKGVIWSFDVQRFALLKDIEVKEIKEVEKTTELGDFKRELKELLNKHKAYIYCDIDGDTHGLINTMMVEVNKKDYTLCNGNGIDKFDLK